MGEMAGSPQSTPPNPPIPHLAEFLIANSFLSAVHGKRSTISLVLCHGLVDSNF